MSDKENESTMQSPRRSEKERMKLRKKYKDILNEFAQEDNIEHGSQQEEGVIKNAMDRVCNFVKHIQIRASIQLYTRCLLMLLNM